jgi:hypothetical protein
MQMNKYNFKDILEKEIILSPEQGKNASILLEKIEIPKIQRDYAQGRDSEKEVRKRFLDAIFESLSKNMPMEMDFVYGTIDENTFTPLDGQQRLTTLFLLYWYIGTKELETGEREKLYKSLKKFTYETRTSSSRFCEELTKAAISFQDMPSKEIMNLYWFFRSYKQDPTIKSMLNMLDAIHEKYKAENKKLFNNLKNLQFYILPLNSFNLTDELYIKMNARGKQLTDFENLKADLIKWMKDDKNPCSTDFNKDVELDKRKMKYFFSISQKIDTSWTDFFWQITKDYDTIKEEKPEGKIVDPLFIRLFYRYFFQKYILSPKNENISNKEMDSKHDYKLLYEEGKYQNFKVFENILNYDLINNFEIFFDKLKNNWQEIENSISPSWTLNSEKKWTFLNKVEQKDRVIFSAISLFLEQRLDFDKIKFKQWMRVVWNIVENTDIDSTVAMIGAMKLIEELSQNAYEIYAFLANEGNKLESGSSKNAIEEERKKTSFIINNLNESWEETFIDAEKHLFFKGAIGFIITDNMTIDEFKHRKEMAFKVFDEKGVNKKYQNNGHIFLRALISQYIDSKIINQNYIDSDDKEHYLKKMLTSNEVVKNAIREWFNLESEEELKNVLNESVKKDSQIQGWYKNDNQEKIRIRRAHEALYKVPELQNWMQETKAIRFNWRGEHLYISKPRGWYNWIMLDTCRNEVIEYLLKKGFTTDRKISEMPYFWGYDIEVFGFVNNNEYKITFDSGETIKIEKKIADEKWEETKCYNYVEKDIELKELLEKEIFRQS